MSRFLLQATVQGSAAGLMLGLVLLVGQLLKAPVATAQAASG